MTKQEMFDKIAGHLLTQGRKSQNDEGCRYRSPDGLRCALGCLIPDEEYNNSIEGTNINVVLNRLRGWESFPECITKLSDDNLVFLLHLQQIHDWHEPDEWKEKLERLAVDESISPEVLNAFV